jgi:hypothetical protein
VLIYAPPGWTVKYRGDLDVRGQRKRRPVERDRRNADLSHWPTILVPEGGMRGDPDLEPGSRGVVMTTSLVV